jgi:hypothetical protein
MMVLASAFRDGPKSKFYCRRKEKVMTGRTRARRDDSMLPHDADAREHRGPGEFLADEMGLWTSGVSAAGEGGHAPMIPPI